MGSRLTETNRGALLVSGLRLVDTTFLAVNDGGANNSSFTEAGPRQGSAVTSDENAKLRPLVSAAQDGKLDLAVNVGGLPGILGTRVIWREDGELATDYRGWNHPVFLAGWDPIEWTDALTLDEFDVAVVPSSQQVIAATPGEAYLWDRTTPGEAWSASGAFVGSGTRSAPALLVIPGTERVLHASWTATDFAINVSFSDDEGATWGLYAVRASDLRPFSTTIPTQTRMAFHPSTGNIVLFTEESVSGDMAQYASNDLGTTFTRVGSTRTVFGLQPSVFSIPGSTSLMFVYRDFTTNRPNCIVLGSAYEDSSDVTPVEIDAVTTVLDLTAYADADGIVYVFGREGAGNADLVRVWRSTDVGVTWEEYTDLLFSSGDTSTYPTNWASAAGAGGGVIVTNHSGVPGNEDGSLSSLWLGGWSNVVGSHGDNGVNSGLTVDDLEMMGWGIDAATRGRTFLPFDLLEDQGWTRAGTAPTLLAGAENISTAAATSIMTLGPWTTNQETASLMFRVQLVSGATADASTNEVAIEVRIGDGVNQWIMELRLGTAAYALHDQLAAAAIGVDAAVDLTDYLVIAVRLVKGAGTTMTASTWHWRQGDSKATIGPTGTVSTALSANTSRIRLGHLSNTTAVSNWRTECIRGDSTPILVNDGLTGPGRPISALPYPLPDLGTAAVFSRLSAQAGPGRVGDSFDIDSEHDFPVEHLLPALHPSTQKVWRSTSTAEQRISFTLGADATDATRLGGGYSLGLGLFNCRGFRTAQLRGFTTAGGWTVLGTMDLGISVPFADKIGDIITPSAGNLAAGDRYYRHGEFVGGYWIFDEGNSTFEIVHHNSGWWTTNTTAVPHFRVLAPTGVANATAAEGNVLVSPSGVLVVHLAEDTVYERFQVRITASQQSPWSYYQIGTMVMGAVLPLGQQPSNGWQKRLVPNVEETVSRSGERRIRELGPPVWEWRWSWLDGLLVPRLAIDADYRGSSVGAPLIQTQDVFHTMAGLLQRDTKSGEYPVVALEEMPDADGTTITAPDLYCYGSMTSAVQATQIQGDDGAPEFLRVESVSVAGQP